MVLKRRLVDFQREQDPFAVKVFLPPTDHYRQRNWIMTSPEQQMDTLREGLSRVILDQLAETLRDYSSGNLANPVLRFEAFIQDGEPGTQGQTPRSPVVSVSCISMFIIAGWTARWRRNVCKCSAFMLPVDSSSTAQTIPEIPNQDR